MIGWYIALVLYVLGSLLMILFIVDWCKRDEHWLVLEEAHKNKTHIWTAIVGSVLASIWPLTTLVMWERLLTKDEDKK